MNSAETVLEPPHPAKQIALQTEAKVVQKNSVAPYAARRRKRIRVQLAKRRRQSLVVKAPVAAF